MSQIQAQILICTLGFKGIERIAAGTWPVIEGAEYLVSVQDPEGVMTDADLAPLRRMGMKAKITRAAGIGNNRNHAFDMATAPVVFLADDDLRYDAAEMQKALKEIAARPDMEMFAFRYSGPDNKYYPPNNVPLHKPHRGYWHTSFELAFRRQALVDAGLRYSTLISFGAPYLTSGDENLFLANCINRGFKGEFIPITICEHPDLTSGNKRQAEPGVVRSNAAIARVRCGLFGGLLRCPVIAKRSPAPTLKALVWAIQGYCYSIKHRKSLESL